MDYEGGCHCGRVRFRVSGDLAQTIDCNCSICVRFLDGVDPRDVQAIPFDGRNWDQAAADRASQVPTGAKATTL